MVIQIFLLNFAYLCGINLAYYYYTFIENIYSRQIGQIGGINKALAINGGKFLLGAALRGHALRLADEPAALYPSI